MAASTTTSELVTVDGVVLNTFCYNITSGTGRYTVPDVRVDKLYLPGRSGYVPLANAPYNEGEIVWTMFVLGCNPDFTIPTTTSLRRQKFETNLASLLKIFSVRTRLSHVTAVQADGTTREAYVEVTDRIDPTTMAGRQRAEFAVSLNIPDVYWQDTSTNTQASATGSSLPKTLNLTGLAGMTGTIEDAVVTVTGPITNPRVTDVESGCYVQYNGTVANGSSWVVDCGAFTSKVGSTDVTLNTVHNGHWRYLVIPSFLNGQNYPQVTLSGTGGGTATKVQVAAHRKFFTG